MARASYTVKAGDTLANVARKYYGAGNQSERIVNTNGILQYRRQAGDSALDGTPNLHPGDVLTIVVDNPITAAPRGAAKDKISIFLDSTQVSLPEGSVLERYFDSCCAVFDATFPWNPNSKQDLAWWGDPRNLAECTMYAGERNIFGGKFYTSRTVGAPADKSVITRAKSHTQKMFKSVLPSMAYPVEWENEDLLSICERACNIWGFTVEDLAGSNEKFKKVAFKKDQRIYDRLSELANVRGHVLGVTPDGYGFQIRNPQVQAPIVARFVEGEAGFTPPEFEFDTEALHNTYVGSSRSARKASNIRGYRDNSLQEQSYEYIELKGTNPAELQQSLEYNARKKYREFFETTFDPGGGLLNPQGDLWEPGQLITVKAPTSRLFTDTTFLVRMVRYNLDPGEESVDLGIIPPWVYAGIGQGFVEQQQALAMWDNLG
jgi:hypothetical protein